MTDGEWTLELRVTNPDGYAVCATFGYDSVDKLLNYPLSENTGKCIRGLARGLKEEMAEGYPTLDGKDDVVIMDKELT